MSALNKGVIRQWITALRSGDYKQTRGKLGKIADNGSRSYCCLGVLCELAVAEGLIDPPALKPPINTHFTHSVLTYDLEEAQPPGAVRHFIGDPYFGWTVPVAVLDPARNVEDDGIGTGMVGVAALNDGYEFSFEDIADAIEAAYLADEMASVE